MREKDSEVIQLYLAKVPLKEIESKLKVSHTTIRNILKRNNIESHTYAAIKERFNINLETLKQELQYGTPEAISRKYGCSTETIEYYRRFLKVKMLKHASDIFIAKNEKAHAIYCVKFVNKYFPNTSNVRTNFEYDCFINNIHIDDAFSKLYWYFNVDKSCGFWADLEHWIDYMEEQIKKECITE